MYRGRDPEALFSLAAEQGNIDSTNGILDGVLARKSEMARRTEEQIKTLLVNPSYGRNRALGPTASEASSRLSTARDAGLL